MADTFCCLINVITLSFSTMATGIGPDSGCHNNLNLAQKGRMRHIAFCFLSPQAFSITSLVEITQDYLNAGLWSITIIYQTVI